MTAEAQVAMYLVSLKLPMGKKVATGHCEANLTSSSPLFLQSPDHLGICFKRLRLASGSHISIPWAEKAKD